MNSRSLYLRLLRYLKPYRGIFALAVSGMIIGAAAEPALPALLKPLLDGGFVARDQQIMLWTPFLLVLVGFIRGAGGFISGVAMTWVASRLVMDLRQTMFAKLLCLPTVEFDETSAGVLLSKLTYDANRVTQSGTEALVTLVRDSLTTLGLLAWMFYVNWQLSLIVFTIAPIIILVIKNVGKRLRRLNVALQKGMGEMTHILEEAIGGHKLVKVFAGQTYEMKRFNNASNNLRQLEVKVQLASNAAMLIVQTLIALALAGIIFIAVWHSEQKGVTVGSFVSLFAAMGMLFAPIKRLTKVNEYLQQGLAAAQSVFDLLDKPAEADRGNYPLQKLSGQISFKNLNFTYPDGDSVITDFSLDIQDGETLALVGASGSGKTTLAHLIPRFYELAEGQIFLDGVDINHLPLAALRANLALVSQDVVLFNDTVRANIAYGAMSGASFDAIRAAAEAAFALEFIETLPRGFDTIIGERGIKLSGGQRQRLAIARALLKNAPILIFDEATSALDSHAERYVQQSLEKLRRGRTLLIIAYRLSTIENADRIVVMENGKIAEIGNHHDLLMQDGVYARLYRAQQTVNSNPP